MKLKMNSADINALKVSRDHYRSEFEKLTTEGMLWRPIDKDAKWKHRFIIGLTEDNNVVKAHFAQDLSGEEQPAFSGFYVNHNGYNTEVYLKAYMPYPVVKAMRVTCRKCEGRFDPRVCENCNDTRVVLLPEEK